MKKKKTEKNRSWFDWAVLLIFFGGLALFLYPSVSNLWNVYRQQLLSVNYDHMMESEGEEDFEPLFEEAQAYNAGHQHLALDDPYGSGDGSDAAYRKFLNPGSSDVMGYLEIPKIGQKLMIYYGTGEEGLAKGVGHMEGSSLPVGGPSTHAVLAGHRGLPSARIFTDLDQLQKGDLFTIKVLDRTMAYRVDQIQVIDPQDIDALEIVPGKDYVTLLTCTPYGVNTQRLLVRGERTEWSPAVEEEIKEQQHSPISPIGAALICGIVLMTGLGIWYLVSSRKNRRDKQT